ncbi:hypothetical protein BaRGS_00007648, partial [Batillaria attramentaria]
MNRFVRRIKSYSSTHETLCCTCQSNVYAKHARTERPLVSPANRVEIPVFCIRGWSTSFYCPLFRGCFCGAQPA